jgi:predicted nucleic acid-binding protein
LSDRQPGVLVLDATIAIKWYLNDEDHVLDAQRILDRFSAGDVSLIAPDHIRYELVNALLTAVRSRRISDEAARSAMNDFLSLDIPTIRDDALLVSGFETASFYECALYDALYLVLAERASVPFVHADRRLRNTLRQRFPNEMWIDDLKI